jgi:hypothetical protein
VLISRKKLEELQKRSAQLDALLNPEKAIPTTCKLKLWVEGGYALVEADLAIKTERPRTLVVLGFEKAFLTADPEMDNALAVLGGGPEKGYTVQVDKAGEHSLALKLKVPVTVQRPDLLAISYLMDMSLPGAPTTVLNLDLRGARDVRCKTYSEKAQAKITYSEKAQAKVLLGRAQNLELTWKEPPPAPKGGSVVTAKWAVIASIKETEAVLSAHLTLDDRFASRTDWQLAVPAQADVKVVSPDPSSYSVKPPDAAGRCTIKGPATQRLEVHVEARRKRPFVRLPVGPFAVLGVERQEGTTEARATPRTLRGYRISYVLQGDIQQQDPPSGGGASDLQARFQHWGAVANGKGAANPQPHLALELKPVTSLVETDVEHLLQIGPADDGVMIQGITRVHAVPLHSEIDFIEVLLPGPFPPLLGAFAGPTPDGGVCSLANTALFLHLLEKTGPIQYFGEYRCNAEVPGGAQQTLVGPGAGKIYLSAPQKKAFTVVLTWKARLPTDAARVHLLLPKPVSAFDRGGKVKVELDKRFELDLPAEGAEDGLPEPHRVTLSWGRAPAAVNLAWKPYRPELPAQILADLTLRSRSAHVRQVIRVDKAEPKAGPGKIQQPRVLRLRAPEDAHKPRIVEGGAGDLQTGRLQLTGPPGTPLVIEYHLNLPPKADTQELQVALFWPEEATSVQAKVRVWSEPGLVPELAEPPLGAELWRERGTEVVADKTVLPVLVLEAEGQTLPLALRLRDAELPSLADGVVELALINVRVDEEGTAVYHARFVLSRLASEELEIEVPGPLTQAPPSIHLDKNQLTWQPVQPDNNRVRVQIPPGQTMRRATLVVEYRLTPDLAGPQGFLQLGLQPPRLPGVVLQGPVRWQVSLPSSWVALPPVGHSLPEHHWQPRGWWLALEPSAHSLVPQRPGEEPWPAPTLVFSTSSVAPVVIVHCQQQAWLFLCSFVLILIVLGLLAVSWLTRWVVLAILGLSLVAVGMSWPALLPALLYGCEPGLVIVAVLLLGRWLLYHRYRRQVVYLPAFSRARPASSATRGSSAKQRQETSTVDAPPSLPVPASKASGSSKELVK